MGEMSLRKQLRGQEPLTSTIGEMSLRIDRRRKDLAASFNRLKYMVDDIKSARKSLTAHHRQIAEFVSVSLLSAVPSSNASSPQDSPFDLHIDDSQEVCKRSITFCVTPPSSKPANVMLDDLREVGSPNLQIYNSQDVDTTLQGPVAFPVLPFESLSPELCTPTISVSPTAPLSVNAVCHDSLSALSCKNLEEVDSASSCQQMVAYPRMLTCQSILWASLLLTFLCFFLFMGKKVAIGFTVTAYAALWLIFKGLCFSKIIPRYMRSKGFRPRAREGMQQNRNSILLSSSASQSGTGLQSLPMLHGCAQRESYAIKGPSINHKPSSRAGTQFARFKLGIMLVLALCGLAHGQIMAVCMCSSCVLMVSEMQRLASKM